MVMIITIVLCELYKRSRFIVSCIEIDIDTQILCKYYDILLYKIMSYSLCRIPIIINELISIFTTQGYGNGFQ